GRYTVTATATGATPVDFTLTNASLVVTTTLDDIDDTDAMTSLRKAIVYAHDLPGANTITFDPTVFGTTPQTITLSSGPLELTDPATTTIAGPGAELLSISGKKATRVFDIEGGSVTLSGLTVTGGFADRGGGLFNNGGAVSLENAEVSNNRADS